MSDERVINVLQIGCENFGRGGRSVIIYNLMQNLENSFCVDYVTTSEEIDNEYISTIQKRGGDLIRWDTGNSCKNYIRKEKIRFTELRKILINKKYDIVHVNCDDAWDALNSAIVPAFMRNSVIVIHGHASGHDGHWSFLKRVVVYFSKCLINIIADARLACSYSAAEYLFGRIGCQKNKPSILHNGINVENYIFKPEVRERIRIEMGYTDKDIVVGSVGRIRDIKNPLFAIDVINEFLKLNRKIKYFWIGDGELFDDVNSKIIDYSLENVIKLIGYKKNVCDYYHAMDILMIPSKHEGFPLVAIEGQAAGIPVICSKGCPTEIDVTGLVEFIDLNSGFKNWANRINEIVDRKIDRKKVGLSLLGSKIDIKMSSKILEEIYRETLSR